jgi:Uma2 family endonuclease
MYERVEDEIAFSNDFSPLEEESMPEAAFHDKLLLYLVEVLEWLFHGHLCAIHRNLAFYRIHEGTVLAVAPDLAVVKGLPFQLVKSWRVDDTGPAPQVVFEILSEETWKKDLQEKPEIYARLGVQEYFAYDPNLSPLAEATAQRLFGWRRDPVSGHMTALILNKDTSLWSSELDSSLLPDKQLLRLYDRDGQLRLTQAEAEAAARQAAEWQVQAEAAARQAAEWRARVLIEKLRAQGIDPDKL